MSDFAPSSLATEAVAPSADGLSGGMLLRRAREAAGLHTEALAAILKVPVLKIQALEADRFDLLPDLVFVRALASSVCRQLGIDAQPVLERLPRKAPPRLAQSRDHVNAPFRGPNDAARTGWREQLVRPPVLAVLVLLLGALAVMLVPQSVLDDAAAFARDRLSDAAQPRVSSASVIEPVVAQAPDARPEPAAAAPMLAAGPTLASYAPSAADSAAPDAPLSAPDALPAAAPAPPPEAGAATGLIVFRTTGPSWVEVKDAQGVVALRRMLDAGETADASGTPPLSVTVGKADVTQVQVRGQAFDLSGVSRDNVARFQVR